MISDHVVIEMLDVNLLEYKDQDFARVRFYPNGTCDEFTLILHSDRGEWIKISLEITTSLANVGPVDRDEYAFNSPTALPRACLVRRPGQEF